MSPLPIPRGRATSFLWELVRQRRRVVLLVLGLGVMAAALEGGTMGLFALALHTLTGGSEVRLADDFGAFGRLADSAFASLGTGGLFLTLVGLAIVSQLLRSGLQFGGGVAAARLQSDIEGAVRRRIFRRFMLMTYGHIRRFAIGDLASYMAQVSHLGQVIQRSNMILGQLLLLAAYLVVLFWLSWIGTLLAAVAMVLASLSLRRIVRRIHTEATSYKNSFINVNELTVEFLNGIRLVHSYGREEYAEQRTGEVIDACVGARRRSIVWQASVSPLVDSLAVIGVGLCLMLGYVYLGGESSGAVARYATFLFVLYRLAPRLSTINKNWGLAHGYLPFVDRIAGLLADDDEVRATKGGRSFAGLRRDIELRDVSLRYDKESERALHGIDFTLRRGETVAVVGESGSGKSSIADLLIGLYKPTAGRILVDGEDLQELDPEDWLGRLAVVSQRTFLLNGSVAENIGFGRLDATEEEIVDAARRAHADEFVTRMPEGYATTVGEQGYRLSGGQRQRIAIARAILRDPDLLILDEATSGLDSRSERAIQASLAEIGRERSVLVIAHRLSTVVGADRILMLAEGRIEEQGTHDELLARGGLYAYHWGLQMASSGRATAPLREADEPQRPLAAQAREGERSTG